jgi:hypothetical protein
MVVLLGEMKPIPEAGLGPRYSLVGCLKWKSTRIGVQSLMGSVNTSPIVVVCGLKLLAMEEKIYAEKRKARIAK